MNDVTIHEVGPRDGLQNEPGVIRTDDKVALINALAAAGLTQIEVGSFVSPKWVPQMADTPQVLAALPPGPDYAVLVPNMRGWNGYMAAAKPPSVAIAIFVSASEGFSQANLNCSIADSIARAAPVVAAATHLGVTVRGYISCVTDCPFDGPTQPQQVANVAQALRKLAPMPLSLGDTIGEGTPDTISAMLDAVLKDVPADAIAGHYHDTGGQALANVAASLDRGIRAFDAAVGGLGGCPYAPGAPGNLATGELVAMLHARGFATGVDPAKLAQASALAQNMRKRSDAEPHA